MIKNASEMVAAPRIDKTGDCFVDQRGHYYRQESTRVIHVDTGIINVLGENAINDNRLNWNHEFTKIDPELFDEKMKDVLETFFEII